MGGLPLLVVLVLGALSAFAPMSIDMYLPAFPAIADSLKATPGQVAYTLSAFFVGLSAGQLVYGPLADRFGRKPPLLAGIALYLAASVGCAVAPDVSWLVALRALQALGGCAGVVISRAMVRDMFAPQDAARIFSILMLVMGLAPILAPLLGGLVLGVAGWRGIFGALALFGLASLVGSLTALRETHPPDARVRLGLGAVLGVYGSFLADARFMGFALSGSVAQAGMFAYIAGSPFVFITLNHVPAQHYGWLFGTNALGLIAASQLNARLLKTRAAGDVLLRALTVCMASGLALLGTTLTGFGGFVGLLVPLFCYVASLGFITPNATALALSTRHTHLGQASALTGTVQFAAATLSGALVGALQNGTAMPMAGVIAGCGVVALGCAALVRPARPSGSPESPGSRS